MTNFTYQARDRQGNLTAGSLEAADTKTAVLELEKIALTPISIQPAGSNNPLAQIEDWWSGVRAVKKEELIVFSRQLSSVLEAGVPLIEGLDAVAEQMHDRKLRQAVLAVKKDIENGVGLAAALEKSPQVFSSLIVSMVRAGEKAGILPQVLDRVSALLEKDVETEDKIKSATRYPTIVLGTLALAFLVLNFYVIPRFATFFSAFKTELPLPTRILMVINVTVANYWPLFLALVIGAVYGFRRLLATQEGRRRWDALMLRLPVFGPLFTRIYLSRFGRMLAAMQGSGIPILDALSITAGTIDNKVLSGVVLEISQDVAQGKNLMTAMKEKKVFPPIALSMVGIGEKAGTLEQMLDKLADYFDREADYTIKNLTPLIEPLLILGLGVMMLIFALGIFLPMWDVVKVFQSH